MQAARNLARNVRAASRPSRGCLLDRPGTGCCDVWDPPSGEQSHCLLLGHSDTPQDRAVPLTSPLGTALSFRELQSFNLHRCSVGRARLALKRSGPRWRKTGCVCCPCPCPPRREQTLRAPCEGGQRTRRAAECEAEEEETDFASQDERRRRTAARVLLQPLREVPGERGGFPLPSVQGLG